jgi:hypothetical protein
MSAQTVPKQFPHDLVARPDAHIESIFVNLCEQFLGKREADGFVRHGILHVSRTVVDAWGSSVTIAHIGDIVNASRIDDGPENENGCESPPTGSAQPSCER